VERGELLLDIGSGYGRVLDYLETKGFKHIFGLESNFRCLARNRSSVVYGKGEQAPFKEKSFGAIFSIGVLSYILEDTKRKQLVNEIYRTLKSRGFLFMSCFVISGDEYHQKKYREGPIESKEYGIFESDSGGTFRHSQEEELRELLVNFQILNWKPRPFTTMNGRPASGLIIEAQKP
jgi:SAM-dependent methyltransferase